MDTLNKYFLLQKLFYTALTKYTSRKMKCLVEVSGYWSQDDFTYDAIYASLQNGARRYSRLFTNEEQIHNYNRRFMVD